MTSFNRNITPVRKTFLSPFPAAETAIRESKSLPQGHTASEHSRWFSACPYSLGMYLSTLASQTSSCQHLRAFFLWLRAPLSASGAGQKCWAVTIPEQLSTNDCWVLVDKYPNSLAPRVRGLLLWGVFFTGSQSRRRIRLWLSTGVTGLKLFVCDFRPFLFSLLHALSNVSWSHLPDRPLVLQSLPQGLFLGKSTLRVEKVGV